MKIINRWDREVVYQDDSKTVKETVANALERYANLRDANLHRADLSYADLSDADLSGANLRYADLSNADFDIPFTPDPDLIKKVAAAALPGNLKMDRWHTCKTVHCIAGWGVILHPEGKLLERFTSTYLAARFLLGDKVAEHFFDSDEDAKEYLKQFLA